MAGDAPRLFETGIPNLDLLLGGGIPSRQSLIVTGTPGGGKTILVNQIAFHAAARGIPVVFATLTSEPHDKLVEQLSRLKFFRPDLLGEQFFLVNTYAAVKKGDKEARDLLLGAVRERSARLLVIDGLRTLRDVWQDEARMREFLYELATALAALDCVAIFTTEFTTASLLDLPEATTLDGILSLTVKNHGVRRPRRIEVVKLRGRRHMTGEHFLAIGDEGIRIVPRLEALAPSSSDLVPADGRAGFGVPEFDALMDGGLPAGSTTMLAGSMGIGKTLFSLHFALDGARKGEKALFVTFVEEPRVLVARAQRVAVDLQPFIAGGALHLLYEPPTEIEADDLVDRVLAELARLGARRLVIDGLGTLEVSVVDAGREDMFFAALSRRLRLAGVTTLFTKEVAKVAGNELDFGNTPIAILGENLLLLRFVELRGRIHRILSVLKMRDTEYQSDVREFQITDQGIRVLGPLRSVQGLLTGQAVPVGSTPGEETAKETS
jgi:circadian clock protein KaiC